MSGALKTLCLVCFVLWVLEGMGFNGSAYITGYMVSSTVKDVLYSFGSFSVDFLGAVFEAGASVVTSAL